MGWQLLRRAAIFAASVLVAAAVVFGLLTLVGDPARTLLGTHATPEALIATRLRMGLDRPLISQFGSWLGGMVRGDFGTSYVTHIPIGPQLADKLLVTTQLVLGGMVLALVLAIPAGTVAALANRRPWGTAVSALSRIGIAVPAFLAGILLVAVFAVGLGWLPAGGYLSPSTDLVGFLRRMVLPWASLGLIQGSVLTRYVRTAVLDEMRRDYVRTARGKGMTTAQAVRRHGLRNAAVPILTVLGVQMITILIGAVVVERVFAIPGVGSFLVDSVARQDRLAVQGIVVTIVVIALAVSFVVDALYVVIDPRLRHG